MLCPFLIPVFLRRLFSEGESSQLPLFCLYLQYVVFDCVFDNQTDNFTCSCLPKTVHSVHGLIFDGRRPPRVAEDDLKRH